MASFPHSLRYIVPENNIGAAIDYETGKLGIPAGQAFKLIIEIRD